MAIQDDGRGFDATRPVGEGHYGLRFIRERAEGMGGRLSIDSAPGQGTRLTLEVPVNH
jgi:signal transduction histidine kinase